MLFSRKSKLISLATQAIQLSYVAAAGFKVRIFCILPFLQTGHRAISFPKRRQRISTVLSPSNFDLCAGEPVNYLHIARFFFLVRFASNP